MEIHQVALAALDQIPQAPRTTSASHRDIGASRVAPSSATTAAGMRSSAANKEIVGDAVNTPERSQALGGSDRYMRLSGQGRDGPSDAQQALKVTTSGDNSQSTTDGHETTSTPPTSASDGFSSQSTNPDGQLCHLSQLSQLAATQQLLGHASSTRPMLSIAQTAGQKRTADGQVKPLSVSPEIPKARGHSRNTSAISNASSVSRIGELSSELRTRLSYAMVKVNKGWQSNSIDEVESLASQAGSPTSSTSTLPSRRALVTSPRAAIATLQAQSSNSSKMSQDFDLYPRGEQPSSQTYESFWRSHSTPNYTAQPQISRAPIISPPPSKALGPPADIRPAVHSRRSGTPKYSKPPNMPGHGSNSPYNGTPAPRTPLRTDGRDHTIIQTPVQKTIQEQAAIETLIFMSSPGNSGNMGHPFPPPRIQGSPQQSPLRSEFSAHNRAPHARRVEFDPAVPNVSAGRSEGAEYRSKIRSQGVSQSEAKSEEMNRFLDEMRDSSSDEEDIPLTYSSPRRIAPGRV
ncbi:hypothetical protein LZ554_003128 [Drepanopeziza brunnea f. sp. 'monogermtubi']|nr:hypothetical protein LZ554_003128 [Drepanopeziza brunnea f. sp. 'monogermtubi']